MTSLIKSIKIKKGQKIAQLIVSNIMYPEIKKVKYFKGTERNNKRFGKMDLYITMSDDFIKMINNIDFLYGFIYECADLVNNLYDYSNYDHLAIKLCSEFVMPIINITKKEHIKEYNEHIKDIIDNLKSAKDIYSICSYLMNICCKEYFKLSQDEYLKIKEFMNNNIDIIESALAPIIIILIYIKNAMAIVIARVIIIIRKK